MTTSPTLSAAWDGTHVRLRLDPPAPPGTRLALTSLVVLSPHLTQVGTYHELDPGRLDRLTVSHAPRHANDGPTSAFLIHPDGSTTDVAVTDMTDGVPDRPRTRPRRRTDTDGAPTEPLELDFSGEPAYAFRGLHVDLARHWFEPDVVLRVLDACAERRLTHLHLHLTDDEAWRLPVAQYPALAEVGGTRGHGRPLPPMLGGGPRPYGRAYTPAEIGRWVARAEALGIVLVPEVDLPAHNHAALAALPELRDPGDTSAAASVQFFTDNVLVPGRPETDRFLTAVVDTLAELFPNSPYLHIGGDEVADGAWRGSPTVQRLMAEHGLTTRREMEGWFHRRLVALVRERTGRKVGAWQEAAESGGVQPGDGYVIGWRDRASSRRLAAAGFDVVVAPGDAYYLDMVVDDRWDTPGMSWAGATSLDDVIGFDPAAGWSRTERERLFGVQACLWTELVPDEETLWRRLLPRLDAVARRAWHG